jgi:predicted transposase/invertase (TIGR01784 family)
MNLSAAYIKKQQEWLEEGKQEGRQEGIDLKGREVAIAALREGCSPELIIKLTGFSLEEIQQLRANLN